MAALTGLDIMLSLFEPVGNVCGTWTGFPLYGRIE